MTSPGMLLIALAGLGLGVWVLAKIGRALASMAEALAAMAVVFFALWWACKVVFWLFSQVVIHWRTSLTVIAVYLWCVWVGWVWLVTNLVGLTLYGVQPKGAGSKTTPGHCKGRAHRRTTLGLPGRRVLVSRKWSGKTLDDHKADRKAFVTQALAAIGIEKPQPDPARLVWRRSSPATRRSRPGRIWSCARSRNGSRGGPSTTGRYSLPLDHQGTVRKLRQLSSRLDLEGEA